MFKRKGIPRNKRGSYNPIEERIYKYIEPEPNSGCWLWAGYATGGDPSVGNYGYISVKGHSQRAHRVMYALHYNVVLSSDVFVLHKCDVPLCVNPDHLFLGSQQDNIDDMIVKGRAGWMR